MPARSSGCANCRARKIRCDEARPACKRCATHGVACPGYRDPAPGEIAFEDMTAATVQRVQEQYRARGESGGKGAMTVIQSYAPGQAKGSSTGAVPKSLGAKSTPARKSAATAAAAAARNGLERSYDSENYSANSSQSLVLRSSEPTITLDLPSTALFKVQLYNAFLDSYLPKISTNYPDQAAHYQYLTLITQTPASRPELAASLDALSLVAVGSLNHDQRMQRQAMQQYGRGLSLLSKRLSRPDAAKYVQDDALLATINLLSTCEFFDVIRTSGEPGWTRHVEGSEQLLALRGPGSINTKMSYLLLSNLQHMTLSNALINRKASLLAQPEWRELLRRDTLPDNRTVFYDSALQVPGLLERSDNLSIEEPSAVWEIDALLAEAGRLEMGLRQVYTTIQTIAELNDSAQKLQDIEKFETFARICPDRSIDRAYVFPSIVSGFLFSVHCNTMYFLRAEIQKLHVLRHKVDNTWFPDSDQTVSEEELMQYIMDMCRCMPYFCEPSSSSTGSIGMFLPLRTASFHFISRGQWKLAKWMAMVRDNCFIRGITPPSVRDNQSVVPYLNAISRGGGTGRPSQSPSGFSSSSSPDPFSSDSSSPGSTSSPKF